MTPNQAVLHPGDTNSFITTFLPRNLGKFDIELGL
jgi:hypothetical protein